MVWHGGGGGGSGKRDLDVTVGDGVDYDDADAEGDDAAGTGERALKDKSNVALNRSMKANAYRVLVEAGPQGMAQMDFSRKLGIGKLESRAVHRWV